MKLNLLILLFLSLSASAKSQIITTYDSYAGISAVSSKYTALDLNPEKKDEQRVDWSSFYKSVRAPALWDIYYKVGVTITGSIAQAEVDLATSISNAYPASAKFRDMDKRAETKKGRERLNGSGSTQKRVEELEAEVKRLSEIVESILEMQGR